MKTISIKNNGTAHNEYRINTGFLQRSLKLRVERDVSPRIERKTRTASTLSEESKLLEDGFQYVRYRDKDELAIYRKCK